MHGAGVTRYMLTPWSLIARDSNISYDRPIPYSYWVKRGQLLAGEYPGSQITRSPKRTARTLMDTLLALVFLGPKGRKGNKRKISNLVRAGVTLFIDLTEPNELKPYEPLLAQEADKMGRSVEFARFAIRDRHIPTKDQMAEILDAIDRSIESGGTVYVHCLRGIGRTGTVVGCYLARHGTTGEQALHEIGRLRKGLLSSSWRSPETEQQRQMVMHWEDNDSN